MAEKLDMERIETILHDKFKSQIIDWQFNDDEYLTLDFIIIDAYYYELGNSIINNYEVTKQRLEFLISRMLHNKVKKPVKINFKDVPITPIKALHSNYNGKLVSFEGIVKNRSNTYQECTLMAFECRACGTSMTIAPNENGVIYTPKIKCPNCNSKKGYMKNFELSKFKDLQKVEITEPLDQLSGGFQPEEITVFLEGSNINSVLPGDKVQVNGLLEVKQYPKKNLYYEYIVADCVQQVEQKFGDIIITTKDKQEILELSQEPQLFDLLVSSVVPSIFGYEEVKLALALQLAGADSQDIMGSRTRGDVHILLMGDPGIGKSQILKYISTLAPRSIYTSGKGSTGAGLTATAVKDDFGGWSLEAGALVLGDNGLVCIDEFDKMREEDRSAIHEALEQQTISISKAGITTTMNSRCSVLAAANPVFGRIDDYKEIKEQINLSDAILSRFDLIFLIKDKTTKEEDLELTEAILRSYKLDRANDVIDPELLKKYISYARSNFNPVMTDEVIGYLQEHYVNLRELARINNHPIPITTRQLEAIIRLAKASARIRLSETINIEDAERAIKLQEYCIKHIGFDEEKQVVDIDKVEGRTTKSSRDKYFMAKAMLSELEEEWGDVPTQVFIKELENKGYNNPQEVLTKLHQTNMVIEITSNHWRVV